MDSLRQVQRNGPFHEGRGRSCRRPFSLRISGSIIAVFLIKSQSVQHRPNGNIIVGDKFTFR